MAELTLEQQQAIALANARARAAQAKPEQGNMYTQGAEDVVYSPEGIPLSTSAYGAAPTGVTKDVQQALTSTVSLPISAGLGAAKNIAGGAQYVGKKLGSNLGDIPVNAINQIEQGINQQTGAIGSGLNTASSIVGQAAPFMAVGGGGVLPSLAKKIAVGTGTGLLSGYLTPEETGLSSEQFDEAKNKNLLLQGGIGGALPVVGKLGSKLASAIRGGEQPAVLTQGIEKARELGYVMPPSQAKPSLINRLLEGTAGKLSTAQNASAKNQEITNKLAAKSLGLAEDVALTPEILAGVRQEAGKAYDALASLPVKPAVTADAVMNRPAIAELDPKKMVYDLRLMRNNADAYYKAYGRSADPEQLTKAKQAKAAAAAIEDQLEKYAESLGKSDLLPALRDARQLIAKTYTVENALNQTTGTVDAKKLASRLQSGKPMSGELKDIAEFASHFPKATQLPEKMGSLPQFSPLDVASSAATGGLSYLTGNKEEAGPLGLAALLLRPGARYAALSSPIQNRLVQSEAKGIIPQALKKAMPTAEEKKRLAQLLIMQSAAKANQGE